MSSSESFESLIQNLTFGYASRAIESRLGKGRFDKLELKLDNREYNNFALLLSDQCPWGFVIISDHYGELYRSTGSILKQITDIMKVLDCINPKLRIKGRTGSIRRFPRAAVEEGILNAAIHFDIAQVKDIVIDICNDKLTIVSPGGMISPENWDTIVTTSPRNILLADLLKSIGKVNLKLYGIRSIKDSYHRTGRTPMMRKSDDRFIMLCPSVAEDMREKWILSRRISDILADNPGSTLAVISEKTLLSPSVALRAITEMEQEDMAFEMGSNNSKRFYLSEVRKTRQMTMPGASMRNYQAIEDEIQ